MKNKYKDLGLKLTPQRLAILDCLEGNISHPSAEDIYKEVSAKFPTMSFATVYTTLATLKQKGRVAEITIDPDKKRFDPNTERHHHLICTKCRKVVDIFDVYDIEPPKGRCGDFEITGNHIEFYGCCPECR
ncbi:MAG: transcriptional repressor [Nitrospirae bacterium]|nr:transcriptional repressor [Nitrospirota bacterium]